MDILECEVCKAIFAANIDFISENRKYFCPYCGREEAWE